MSGIIDIILSILKVFFGSKKKEEKSEEKKTIIDTNPEIPKYIKPDSEPESIMVYKEPSEPVTPEPEEPVKHRPDHLVYQTELDDKRLNKYGCAFRCYQAIAEITVETYMYIEEIEDLGKKAFEKGYLSGNAEVKKPEDLAKQVLELFGQSKKYKIYNSGYRNNGKALDWSNKPTDNYDFIVTKLIQKNGKDNHFVLCDRDGKMIFDPTPNSISVQLWNVETEYLYKVKKY